MVADHLANFVISLKNASAARKRTVEGVSTKLVEAVATILKKEGFIESFEVKGADAKRRIVATLRYSDEGAAISEAAKVSRYSRRVYRGAKEIRPFRQGYGLRILTTPKGVMTDREARRGNVGGEVLCEIW
jgi:small subunit ribosomal protein S8